jgi:SepF-like predicted cell division protein (DUF552 family)
MIFRIHYIIILVKWMSLSRKLVDDELKVKCKKPCTIKNVFRYTRTDCQKISKQIYRGAQVIAELIDLEKEMCSNKHGEELNLTEDELAFVR